MKKELFDFEVQDKYNNWIKKLKLFSFVVAWQKTEDKKPLSAI